MSGSETSLTLLESLRDPADEQAWLRFDRRYRRLLVRFGHDAGLEFYEAEEAAQRTIAAFCETWRDGNYDRAQGRFKHWLFGIVRHKIADLRAEVKRFPTPIGAPAEAGEPFGGLDDPETLSHIWDRQWQSYVMDECFRRAKGQFSSRDITIFERLTLGQQLAEQVAGEFALSREAVRMIRHRVLRHMREVKDELENAL